MTEMTETKVCGKCKQEKELSEFTKNKSNKDGLDHNCRQCKAEIMKKYRDKQKQREGHVSSAPLQSYPLPPADPLAPERIEPGCVIKMSGGLSIPIDDYPELAEKLKADARANFRANDLPGHVLFILDWYLNLEDE